MNDVSAVQHYVVEIDGVKYSEHVCFVDATKAGLLLQEQSDFAPFGQARSSPDSKLQFL
jgi:hypothetical protein